MNRYLGLEIQVVQEIPSLLVTCQDPAAFALATSDCGGTDEVLRGPLG